MISATLGSDLLLLIFESLMVSELPTQYLLDRLKQSKLLEPAQCDLVTEKVGKKNYPNAAEAAKRLIRSQVITRLQAELLLSTSPERYFIDGYKLLEIVGSGGMGRVYAAQEPDSKWKVALKVLSEQHRQDAGMLARFQIEAQIGLKLQHTNILRTRELRAVEDSIGKINYVVMDLVKGPTLEEILAMKGPLPPSQACDIMLQAAQGLQYMHDKNMVHRDIKPSNLLVSSNGQVKLLDFGLARVDDDDEEFSMAMIFGQDCMGTPDYISPEQSFNSYEVDSRADVYSLGCTFYEALTGVVPFAFETTAEKLKGHRKLLAKRLSKIDSKIPRRVEAVVHKMLAKKPENRIQTMNEVVEYLRPHAERQEPGIDFTDVLRQRVQVDRKRSTYLKRQSQAKSLDDDVDPEGLVTTEGKPWA